MTCVDQCCIIFLNTSMSITKMPRNLKFWTIVWNCCFYIAFSHPTTLPFGPNLSQKKNKEYYTLKIWTQFLFSVSQQEFPYAHCIFRLFLIKSIIWRISKIYLTTNQPYVIRFQKFLKIRKLYSPDPEFRKIETNFFLGSIGCLNEIRPNFRHKKCPFAAHCSS